MICISTNHHKVMVDNTLQLLKTRKIFSAFAKTTHCSSASWSRIHILLLDLP